MCNNGVDILLIARTSCEHLNECIKALADKTDLQKCRVVLFISKPIAANLDLIEINRSVPHLIVFTDKDNWESLSGVLNSINNDIVLLHQDVVVTQNWLEEMQRSAYSKEEIATVSALSNQIRDYLNCSLKYQNEPVEEYAFLIRRQSLRKCPDIPTAIGKCVYIKQESLEFINRSALFSAFENEISLIELCFQMAQLGFIHILCDSVWVYCQEPVVKNVKESFLTLEKDYELQAKLAMKDVDSNRYLFLQENVNLYLPLLNHRKNVLYFLHADFREDASNNVGGTQLHVKDLTQALRHKYNIFVLARDGEYLNLTMYWGEEIKSFRFELGAFPFFPMYTDSNQQNLYRNILAAFQIDVLHVHHTLGQSFDIYWEANKLKIPVISSQHDYYFICPSMTLLDLNHNYCLQSSQNCTDCLLVKMNCNVNLMPKWRSKAEEALKNCEAVVVPSNSVKKVFLEYYPSLNDKITLIEHGCSGHKRFYRDNLADINIAFIGGVSPEKGSRQLHSLIKANRNKNIKWFIFGIIGDGSIDDLNRKDVYKHGRYAQEEIVDLLHNYAISLVMILSLVPETYCYTLTESIQAGVPVIVHDVGALGDRVREMQCGWVLKKSSSMQEVLELIDYIIQTPQDYESKCKNIKELKLKTNSEMALEYEALYSKVLYSRPAQYFTYNPMLFYNAHLTNGPEALSVELQNLKAQLSAIENSFSYKLMLKFKKTPIPFKNIIKKIAFRLFHFYQRHKN